MNEKVFTDSFVKLTNPLLTNISCCVVVALLLLLCCCCFVVVAVFLRIMWLARPDICMVPNDGVGLPITMPTL
jgi:hypothetical protein